MRNPITLTLIGINLVKMMMLVYSCIIC